MSMKKWLLSFIGVDAATTTDKSGWFVDWATGGGPTISGERVNNITALQVDTVFACIRNIAEDIAKLPFIVYQTKGDSKDRKPEHHLYKLLHDQPNSEMSAMDLRTTMTAHALCWGNAYAEIDRDGMGRPAALWPLRPDRTVPYRDDNKKLKYEVTSDSGEKYYFPASEILHVHGLGFDGLMGYNVIHYARETIGQAMAAEKFGSAFFGNSCSASGSLEHPQKLSAEAQQRLIKQIERAHSGASNANKLMVLEEGLKFNRWTIPPEEAQFLETRQFSVPQICRWFRMPPHKVADLTRATFSNIEHQSLEYVGDTLMPWLVRWEQAVWSKLFTEKERNAGYFAKHLVEGLLRGDIASRYGAYAIARNWGWLSADDVRRLEDMNPLPDGQGEKYLIPSNMMDASAEPEELVMPEVPVEPEEEDDEQGEKIKPFMQDAAERISNAELRGLSERIDKASEDRERWNAWCKEFYAKHKLYVLKTLEPFRVSINQVAMMTDWHCDALVTSASPLVIIEGWGKNNTDYIFSILEGRDETI